MIDFENEIYTRIYQRVTDDFPDADVDSLENYMPSHFPFINIIEAENSVRERDRDSGGIENFVNVMYEINVYTRGEKKKETAKAIFASINNEFMKMGFIRLMKSPATFNNGQNFRMVGRFAAAVGADGTVYQR